MYSGMAFGTPWANLPVFSDLQPDEPCPHRSDFDGLFEQAHDNWHGWVGRAACDPIFLSYHANIDRILTAFLTAHPQSQLTSTFPLRPNISNGSDIDYVGPRSFYNITVGDMAKETRALGCVYSITVARKRRPSIQSSAEDGGAGATSAAQRRRLLDRGLKFSSPSRPAPPAPPAKTAGWRRAAAVPAPYVTFQDVLCTSSSFYMDAFVAGAASRAPGPVADPDFVGRVTRIGVGTGQTGGLLQAQGRHAGDSEHGSPTTQCEIQGHRAGGDGGCDRKIISESEWQGWKGSNGKVCWLVNRRS